MARILVVEDNPSNMKLAVLLLGHAGHSVLQAVDAEEGIRQAREHLPELVLMDVQLPGMDGLEATRRLKADEATCGIRIVALTAFAMAQDEERIRASGCDGYITKPVAYKTFVAEVERWLVQEAGTSQGEAQA